MEMTKSISEINEQAAIDIMSLVEQIEAINAKREAEITGLPMEATTAQEVNFFANAFAGLSGIKVNLSNLTNLRVEREAQEAAMAEMKRQEDARKQAIIDEYLAAQKAK